MRIKLFAAALPLLLVACASGPNISPDGDLRSLSDFTVADLQSANALAIAAGDEKAKACYPALIDYVESLQVYRDVTTEAEKNDGAFTAYQRTRNVRRAFDGGVPETVEIYCSALFNDSKTFIGRMLARLGLRAIPGL